MATELTDEGNLTLFNKKLNKLLNKARMRDCMCDPHYTATDLESHFHSSPP